MDNCSKRCTRCELEVVDIPPIIVFVRGLLVAVVVLLRSQPSWRYKVAISLGLQKWY